MRIHLVQFAALVAACVSPCLAQTITTVAGNPKCCATTEGAAANTVWLPSAGGVAMDKAGNIYIWDTSSSKIRKVNAAGIFTTFAGNGTPGFSGDGGLATSAELFGDSGGNAKGIAVDNAGNVYFGDTNNHVVRKINASGIISTVAGTPGTSGFAGDGGQATKAQLFYPAGVAVDSAGNLYIADSSNNRVRKVTAAGVISTYAGNGNVVYSGDGVAATATVVHRPEGLTLDNAGNLYISETSDSRVRKVDANGIISTVAGLTKGTNGFSGDGGPATAATLAGPLGLAVDASGNLYIADNSNGRIRKVDAAGIITTYAGITGNASSPLGDGGPATSAYLGTPRDVTLDSSGNLYIAGSAAGENYIRKVTAAAGLTATPSSLSFAYTTGGATPPSQPVSIASSSGSTAFTASATTTSGTNWLSVTPTSGITPATITVSVNPAGLAAGTYSGAITVTPAGSGISFAVTLTVTGASAPTINTGGIINAAGYQTTLAPDTVFVIYGGGMGPATLTTATAPNYPQNLSGTSITFTPTGGGSVINANMVYTSAGLVAAVTPSSIAPGTYAVRVIYNGIASAPQTITVVARSFGITTSNGIGTGTAQATIANVNGGTSLTRFTSGSVSFGGLNWTLTPAHPGDTVTLWGTGGGADPANDSGGSSGDQTTAGNFFVLVEGRQITPLYSAASAGYPGLWLVNFTLPNDIDLNCFASVQVSAGGTLSNIVTIPIAAAGQNACSDPQLSTSALQQLDAGGSVDFGAVVFSKITLTTTSTAGATTLTQENAEGVFLVYNAISYAAVFGTTRIGPCYITDITSTAAANPAGQVGYLDAGTKLPMSGPGIAAGASVPIAVASPGPIYNAVLANGTLTSGQYSMSGTGGKGVGPFTASVNFPGSFTISGWDSLNSINRSSPLTISWTSSSADLVNIIGTSYTTVGKDASNTNILHTTSFTCQVPAAPGSYTIPTSVLSYLIPVSLGAANGYASIAVEAGNTQPFTASLVGGGSLAFAGANSILGYSRNVAVQ